MADPIDYERRPEPTSKTIDWGSFGAIAYVAAIVITTLACAFFLWFIKSVQND